MKDKTVSYRYNKFDLMSDKIFIRTFRQNLAKIHERLQQKIKKFQTNVKKYCWIRMDP